MKQKTWSLQDRHGHPPLVVLGSNPENDRGLGRVVDMGVLQRCHGDRTERLGTAVDAHEGELDGKAAGAGSTHPSQLLDVGLAGRLAPDGQVHRVLVYRSRRVGRRFPR